MIAYLRENISEAEKTLLIDTAFLHNQASLKNDYNPAVVVGLVQCKMPRQHHVR